MCRVALLLSVLFPSAGRCASVGKRGRAPATFLITPFGVMQTHHWIGGSRLERFVHAAIAAATYWVAHGHPALLITPRMGVLGVIITPHQRVSASGWLGGVGTSYNGFNCSLVGK